MRLAAEDGSDVLATPTVENTKLQNVVNDLHKGTTNPSRVGTGTTADAVRNELETGEPTGGTFHFEKAQQYSTALSNLLKSGNLNDYDQLVAQITAGRSSRCPGRRTVRAGEVAFIGYLAREVPELMPSLQEHLDDYDGLLPHVWLGDVTRWMLQRFKTDPDDPGFKRALHLMDEALSHKDFEAEHQLVSASFVENLPRSGEPNAAILEVVGASVRAQLQRRG